MTNFKKVVALALALMMTFALAVNVSAADYTDQKDIKNIGQATMLRELSIMAGYPDGDFRPAGNLTRGEFAKMVYVAMNNGNDDKATAYVGLSSNVPFTDTKGIWSEGYINSAFSNGIVSGKSPTKFDPEGTLTGYEALKMLCVALGYRSDLEVFTGTSWQLNVLRCASKANLLEGFTGDASAAISRDNAALIIYNTLFAYIVTYKDDKIDSTGSETETFAEKKLRLKAWDGILVGMEKAAIEGDATKAGESAIKFYDANSKLSANSTPVPVGADMSLLGKCVSVYIRYKTTEKDMSAVPTSNNVAKVYGAVTETPNKNTTWTFVYGNDGDLKQEASGTNKNKLSYKDSSDKYHYTAETTTDVIVNYGGLTAKAEDFDANIKPSLKNGSIINMIDNNDDGKAEYVLITNKSYVKVNTNTGSKLTTGYKALTIDGDKYTDAVGPIKDLVKDDRILVYGIGKLDPKDADVVVIEKAPTFAGTVTGQTGSGTGYKVLISGTYYQASKVEGSQVTESTDIFKDENRNVEKTYYTDGTFVTEYTGTDSTESTSGKYLVITGNAEAKSDLSGDKIKINVLQMDGTEAKEKELKKVDGVNVKNNGTAAELGVYNAWKTAGNHVGEIYNFKLNGDGYELTSANKVTSSIGTGTNTIGQKFYSSGDGSLGFNTILPDANNGLNGKLGSTTKVVNANTYVFALKGSDWKVFKGKASTPDIKHAAANTAVGAEMIIGDYNGVNDLIKAVALTKTDTGTITTNYGVVLNDPVYSGSKLSFKMWNGTAVVDATTVAEDDMDSTPGSFGDSPISKGDLLEVTYASANVINSIELRSFGTVINNTKSGNFLFGYITSYDNDLVYTAATSNANADPVSPTLWSLKDLKAYNIDLDTLDYCAVIASADIKSTVVTEGNSIPQNQPDGGKNKYNAILHFNDDGKVDTIWYFAKNIERDAAGASVTPTAMTEFTASGATGDQVLNVTYGSYVFDKITVAKDGAAAADLTNTNYTVAGNTITISQAYLNTLVAGNYVYKIVMTTGLTLTVTLKVN